MADAAKDVQERLGAFKSWSVQSFNMQADAGERTSCELKGEAQFEKGAAFYHVELQKFGDVWKVSDFAFE